MHYKKWFIKGLELLVFGFAFITVVATSGSSDQLATGSYFVKSDCADAPRKEGTLIISDIPDESGTITDTSIDTDSETNTDSETDTDTDYEATTLVMDSGTEYGLPSNNIRESGFKTYLEDENRTCEALTFEDKPEEILFICRNKGSKDITCTVRLTRS